MPSPRIILTGHRGYLGGALKETLAELYPGGLHAVGSDLRDVRRLTDELAPIPGDDVKVLHFATINRGACSSYETHADNCAMLVNLIRATDRFAWRSFLFAGTADVFGTPASLPLTESSPHQPPDWYALSKSVGERVLRQEGVDHAVFRLPGVFGARANERSLLARLLQQGNATGEITLHGRGAALRDFVYLEDFIALVLDWVRSPRSGVWNIASGSSLPLAEMMATLRTLLGASFKVKLSDVRTERDFDLVFDPANLRRDFPDIRIRPLTETLGRYAASWETRVETLPI